MAFCCVQYLPSVSVCKATNHEFPRSTVHYCIARLHSFPAQNQSVKRYEALVRQVSCLDQKAGISRKLWKATWSVQGVHFGYPRHHSRYELAGEEILVLRISIFHHDWCPSSTLQPQPWICSRFDFSTSQTRRHATCRVQSTYTPPPQSLSA